MSGARYEGNFFKDLFNGHGLYTVPPITRDERLRAYVMRMIFEAEKALLRAGAGGVSIGDVFARCS